MDLARISPVDLEERDAVHISTREAGRRLSLTFVLQDEDMPRLAPLSPRGKGHPVLPRARQQSPTYLESSLSVRLAPLRDVRQGEGSPSSEEFRSMADRHLPSIRPSPFAQRSASSASEISRQLHARSDGEIYQDVDPFANHDHSIKLPPLLPTPPERRSTIYDEAFDVTTTIQSGWLGEEGAFVTSPVPTTGTLPQMDIARREEYVSTPRRTDTWLSSVEKRRQYLDEQTALFAPIVPRHSRGVGSEAPRQQFSHVEDGTHSWMATGAHRADGDMYRDSSRTTFLSPPALDARQMRARYDVDQGGPADIPPAYQRPLDPVAPRTRQSMDALGILAAAAEFNEVQAEVAQEELVEDGQSKRVAAAASHSQMRSGQPARSRSYDEERNKVGLPAVLFGINGC